MSRVVACNAVTAGLTVGSITQIRGLPLSISGGLYGLVPSGLPRSRGNGPHGVGLTGTVSYVARLRRTRTSSSPLLHSALHCTEVLRKGMQGAKMRTYKIVVYQSSISS